jgi:phosphate uptake regulator
MIDKPSHMLNRHTWQAYVYMKVCLEIKSNGAFLDGSKMTAKDVLENETHIANCTAILEQYGIELPVLTKPQLELF